MKKSLLVLGALIAVASFAQAPKPSLAISSPPKTVVVGSKLTLTVTINIAPGFHGYQNPPASEYEIPVAIKVDGKDFKVVKVRYPAGVDAAVGGSQQTTKAYEGVVKVPVTLQAPAKPGMKDLKFVVSYQLCDDSSCFPPDQVTRTIKVNVVKKAGA